MHTTYPFSAITAQQTAKTALLLNCIAPSISGVLLSGEKGTAKSTMVRALASLLPDTKLVNVPLSVTDDRLLGSIDIEKALTRGKVEYQPGLLAQANGGILYIDEVNLLSESIINKILDVAASGICTIEREGVSHAFRSNFILVGSMNPEEGALRPQILDRFGFFVELKSSQNIRERVVITQNRLNFENNPSLFASKWKEEEQQLADKIALAQVSLLKVSISDDILTLIAKVCQQAFVAGHRADVAFALGARAHAALNRRKLVNRADVAAVQALALAHRIRNTKAPENETEPENEQEQQEQDNQTQNNQQPPQNQDNSQTSEPETQEAETQTSETPQMQAPPTEPEDEYFEPAALQLNRDVLTPEPDHRKRLTGSGKRCKTRSGVQKGRYANARIPVGKVTDLAFDATLRAAAPFQPSRKKSGLAVVIQKADIRQKVRERRIGNSVLFLVDASGSMGVKKRMSEAKAAVLEMLKQSYVKRDTVGLMTFRQTQASLVLPLTRSVEKANNLLREIKTGGRTPLYEGIQQAFSFMQAQLRKDPDIMPVIVLFSDGRVNRSANDNNPLAQINKIAESIAQSPVRVIVVDTESGFIRLGLAQKIAQSMDAEYFHLDDIKQSNIHSIINN